MLRQLVDCEIARTGVLSYEQCFQPGWIHNTGYLKVSILPGLLGLDVACKHRRRRTKHIVRHKNPPGAGPLYLWLLSRKCN